MVCHWHLGAVTFGGGLSCYNFWVKLGSHDDVLLPNAEAEKNLLSLGRKHGEKNSFFFFTDGAVWYGK